MRLNSVLFTMPGMTTQAMFSSYLKATGPCWQCTFSLIHLFIKKKHSFVTSFQRWKKRAYRPLRKTLERILVYVLHMSFRERAQNLDAIFCTCVEKLVLMSPFDPKIAKEGWPFHLSLNALLALHCHAFIRFCYDNPVLALQRIAREQHIGPLNCSFTINHLIGIDVDTTYDVVLSEFHC